MTKATIAARAADSLGSISGADTAASEPQFADVPIRRIGTAFADYIQLAKPGIIFGNLVSVAGGFFLAAHGQFHLILLLKVFAGVSLVIAGGCAFNNVIDRDIDGKMKRTRKRVLAQGRVSPAMALIYGVALGAGGLGLLYGAVNPLSALLAAIGFVVYVGVYSFYLKRNSTYSTVVGSLSGAMPPVIGYVAISGHFDLGAALLLLTFSLWQMPHSYAIGILYRDDYAAASIPVLPVRHGLKTARRHILAYIAAFVAAASGLTVAGYTGYAYLAVAILGGAYWFSMALPVPEEGDVRRWARRLFGFSILIILALSLLMGIDYRVV